MSTFSTLKLTAAQKPTQIAPVVVRRNKLAKRIWEQQELLKAQQAGAHFAPVKFRTVKDTETGVRKQVETTKRVKAWWFTADNGKLAVSLRYGTRVLELAKGKNSIEVANGDELLSVLETVKRCVEAGELDAQIVAASNAVRARFVK